MPAVVSASALGKRYRIGEDAIGYGRLSESLGNLFRRRPPAPTGREEIWALREASFEVSEGEVVGLIGPNGAGKSTLLKLLARVTEPTTGRAVIRGRVGSLLEVGTGFHQELTGRENVFLSGAVLGMKKAEIIRRFDDIVDFAELGEFIDTPVKRYSSGMGLRLGFAVAAFLEPEVLLVDEILAVGDMKFREKCIGRIDEVSRGDGRTVFFVSHDLNSVMSTCTRAFHVSGGRIVADGPVSEVVRAYEQAMADRDTTSGVFARGSSSPALLREVRIEMDGSTGSSLEHGRPVRFVISTDAGDSPVPRFGVDLQILDHRKRPVCVFSSVEMQGRYFEAGDTIVCELPYLPLATGMYELEISASVPHVQGLDRWSGEVTFAVTRFDPFGVGSTFRPHDVMAHVVPAHSWSAEPPVDAPQPLGHPSAAHEPDGHGAP